MRSRLFAVGAAAALLALAGCSDKKAEASATAPMPPVKLIQAPAASAGGACILWDWAFIQDKIGVQFDTAGSDQVDDTSSCVVRSSAADFPTLALSVVESTDADATIFNANMVPSKGTKLKGLGKASYRLDSKASGDHGPTVEIGWLSEAHQLQNLKFVFAEGADPATVKAMDGKLLTLAQAMDTTNG